MNHKTIAIVLMLGLQLAAGAAHAEGRKHRGDAPVAEQTPAHKANPRYVINGGEVYDKKTDLTWQRCSVGQHWKEGVGCVGLVKSFTFAETRQLGSGNWRVPSLDELRTLIDHKKVDAKLKPTIDEDAFPDMDLDHLYYFTSTPSTEDCYGVGFDQDGRYDGNNRGLSRPVRLVKSGQ